MATVEQSAGPKDEQKKAAARPVGDIEDDLEQTRARLADNLDQLKSEASPKAVAAKAQAKAKAIVLNEDGSVRTERVAAAAGIVVGLLLLRRGIKARARRKELQALAQVVWVPVPRSSVNPQFAQVARNARELAPLAEDVVPALELARA